MRERETASAQPIVVADEAEAGAKIAPSPVAAIKIKMNTASWSERTRKKSINFVDLNFSPGATVSLTKKMLSDTDTDAHSEIHHRAVEAF